MADIDSNKSEKQHRLIDWIMYLDEDVLDDLIEEYLN